MIGSKAMFQVPFLVVLAAMTSEGHAATPSVPPSCKLLFADALPGWGLGPKSAKAVEWAASEHSNPWMAAGDFDGNGARDWAVLGVHEGRSKIAICMNPGRRSKLFATEEPYCSDVIFRAKAGTVVHDLETERKRTIKRDGVSIRTTVDPRSTTRSSPVRNALRRSIGTCENQKPANAASKGPSSGGNA